MPCKHQSDQRDAPMDNPSTEPPAPWPFTFHVESSSTTAMPTNHMIMSELFLPQGYITRRMDDLDTHNQQVQV
ncbi:hypothetical protein Lal_00000871 [Lupinus albus]|nr:hypothetical protein Lal_00000871 [Lupinus albus]